MSATGAFASAGRVGSGYATGDLEGSETGIEAGVAVLGRKESITGQLARLGFVDLTRAKTVLSSPAYARIDAATGSQASVLLEAFGQSADPDQALLSFERILESAEERGLTAELAHALVTDEDFRLQLALILGASEALAEFLVRHPEQFRILVDHALVDTPPTPTQLRDEFVAAVARASDCDGCWMDGAVALRVAYRRRLLALTARDLSGNSSFSQVTGELADLADAVLAACLELARTELPPDAAPCRIAIVSMGKCGGQELNYISDVDVIFVAEPAMLPNGELADEAAALVTATALAKGVMRAANDSTPEGSIWEVDPALRPEGKSGALVRTLASHVGYYERWAQTWEFQALLKARYSAGDEELGREYVEAVSPFVWAAADRNGFVDDVQQMRRRVEDNIPASKSDRELKLGRGGLRDVEFSVQLLQLVHGRSDVMLRSSNTLTALEAMATWGYVGREDAATLAAAYRFLRTMEHRLQLHRLHRTHVVPTDESALRRLGRSMGYRSDPERELVEQWQRHRVSVRRLHEKLFYRPLLNAVARLDSGDARLSQEAAKQRLTALGYIDPEGALRHIQALSAGISRRAAIQRTLLPVLLGWFADAPHPDAGLLGFRRVSEELGGTPWYLRLLRDESETAERLAHLLAASRFATDLLLRAPEGVSLLSDAKDLQPRGRDDLLREMTATAQRHDTADRAAQAIRAVRGRELFRVVAADVNGLLTVPQVTAALTAITDATVEAALGVAIEAVERTTNAALPTRFAVIAMGRLGGNEVGYSSDADAMFVHDPLPGADEAAATKAAIAVANELRRLLALPCPDPPLEIDADLRPEGRSGALVRSLASYRAYYQRWSAAWEAQALLRARPLAGDAELGQRFTALIDPLRWPTAGISDVDVMEIRRLKARMESERLPKGADPALHVKLGRGGLSDVEWVAQLLQMRHAGQPGFDKLRTTETLATLRAAVSYGLLTEADCDTLEQSWCLATRMRNAVYVATGRPSDQVPSDFAVVSSVAFLLGYPPDQRASLTQDYLRVTRQARKVVERTFYEWDA